MRLSLYFLIFTLVSSGITKSALAHPSDNPTLTLRTLNTENIKKHDTPFNSKFLLDKNQPSINVLSIHYNNLFKEKLQIDQKSPKHQQQGQQQAQIRAAHLSTDKHQEINEYLSSHTLNGISISVNGKQCDLDKISFTLENKSNNAIILWLKLRNCDTDIKKLSISAIPYMNLSLEDQDINVNVITDKGWHNQIINIAKEGLTTIAIQNSTNNSLVKNFFHFFKEGMKHILTGIDHLLFVLSIVLIVWLHFYQSNKSYLGRASIVFLKLATLFTVAHAISIVQLFKKEGIIRDSFIEYVILSSIVYVSAAAVEKYINSKNQSIPSSFTIIVFGFFHGLGFTNSLKSLRFNSDTLISTVVAFNLGIEAGQVLFALVSLLLLGALKTHSKRDKIPLILTSAQAIIALIATVWLVIMVSKQIG